ncbi:hypothetical protein HPB49_005616 [Dermacentor silvarum]|uniref:Uncharacterized protein n=1 Tax=Dermacentor silvarum TaxID=543639 RepID=A0ACB8CDD9_DERSI|nr:hypothetical protein HPB49_005616 [Dermacentor silvarum]
MTSNIFFSAANKQAKKLIILGEFNASHPPWGYRTETPKGCRLALAIPLHRLTLLTEPDRPTRTGNSVSRDTCPDLTVVKGLTQCSWSNLMENLGSDHSILATEVQLVATRTTERAIKITNWDAFRHNRTKSEQPDTPSLHE